MFLWTRRMPFIHNLVKKTLPEGWTVLAQCEKSMKKRILFSQEVFFLKRFFWTLRMQFGQPSRENSKQKAKLFAPCEKMLGNRYIKNSVEKFLWTHERQFWQPRWKEFDKSGKISAQWPEMLKTILFSYFFPPQKNAADTY